MKICILARKRLNTNTRILRQANSLSELGFDVIVFCLEKPHERLLEAANTNVTFIEVSLVHPIHKLLRLVHVPTKIYLSGVVRFITLRARIAIAITKLIASCNVLLRRPSVMIGRSKQANAIKNIGIKTNNQVSHIENKRSNIIVRIGKQKERPRLPPAYKDTSLIRLIIRKPVETLIIKPVLILLLSPFNYKRLFDSRYDMTWLELIRHYCAPYFNFMNNYEFAGRVLEIARNYDDLYLVQAHDSHALVAARKLAKEKKLKFVYDIVEVNEERSGPASEAPWLLRLLNNMEEKVSIRKSDLNICIGPSVSKFISDKYKVAQPIVVRNCCFFRKVSKPGNIRNDAALVGSEKLGLVIGAIYNNQGIEQLISALQFLDPNIHIGVLGPEAESGFIDKLTQMANAYGVEGRFHIIPPVPPHELIEYASGADFGIISRQSNCLNNEFSLPNKIFEMVMSRLPVVCGDIKDIRDIVQEAGIGCSFIQSNPENIAQVINEWVGNERLFKKCVDNTEAAAIENCWESESELYKNAVKDII